MMTRRGIVARGSWLVSRASERSRVTRHGPRVTTRRLRGFTLVELLVSIALLTIVSGVVFATFSGGIRVWERIQAVGQEDQWVQIGFEQFRTDLRNAKHFGPVGFHGSYDMVSVPALVPAAPDSDQLEPGELGYYYDSNRRRVCRASFPYRMLRRRRLRDECTTVLSQVERVKLSYYALNPKTGEGGWTGSWESTDPPLAVKMDIRYYDPSTRRPVDRSLVVNVPLSPSPAKAKDQG